MTQTSLSLPWLARQAAVTELLHRYWLDVDLAAGRQAHEFYRPDGVFVISGRRMAGPDSVRQFYAWRRERGERTARHVLSNLCLEHHGTDRVSFQAILCLYAADGVPVLAAAAPNLVADVRGEAVGSAEGSWLFAHHELIPVFEGGVPITIPPAP